LPPASAGFLLGISFDSEKEDNVFLLNFGVSQAAWRYNQGNNPLCSAAARNYNPTT
jgi:hypothetical protein